MLPCTLLSCAMMLFQSGRANIAAREELRGHVGSDNVAWVTEQKKPAVHIRGPMWTRGFAISRTKERSVWCGAGPSGLGTTVGVGMTIDF
jgi:hypothetical protein